MWTRLKNILALSAAPGSLRANLKNHYIGAQNRPAMKSVFAAQIILTTLCQSAISVSQLPFHS